LEKAGRPKLGNSREDIGVSNDVNEVKPAICVDIDNVIAKTDVVMRQVILANSSSQVDLGYEDVVCFEYWKCRDRLGRRLDHSEWKKIHEEFTRNHLMHISPFDNISHHLESIGKKFNVHLATSRLDDGQEYTRLWLRQHSISFDKLHFVPEGTKHLIGEHFVAAVEDDREQGYAFYGKGVQVFLLAHPWNTVGPYSPLRRVVDWGQLISELFNLPLTNTL